MGAQLRLLQPTATSPTTNTVTLPFSLKTTQEISLFGEEINNHSAFQGCEQHCQSDFLSVSECLPSIQILS